jgi:hypothetical protein
VELAIELESERWTKGSGRSSHLTRQVSERRCFAGIQRPGGNRCGERVGSTRLLRYCLVRELPAVCVSDSTKGRAAKMSPCEGRRAC